MQWKKKKKGGILSKDYSVKVSGVDIFLLNVKYNVSQY